MTSQTNLDYVQSLPDLVSEHGAEYDRGVREWEKQMDVEAAELNHTFEQGYYLGMKQEAKQHIWYLLFGLVAGFISGACGVLWML